MTGQATTVGAVVAQIVTPTIIEATHDPDTYDTEGIAGELLAGGWLVTHPGQVECTAPYETLWNIIGRHDTLPAGAAPDIDWGVE